MVACWTMERKRRFASQIGSALANTSKLEQSVMEEVAAKELHALTGESTFAHGVPIEKAPQIAPQAGWHSGWCS